MKTQADYIAEALQTNAAINEPHMPKVNRYVEGLQAKRAEIDDLYIKLYAIVDKPENELLTNDIYQLIDDAEALSKNLDRLIDEMRKQA